MALAHPQPGTRSARSMLPAGRGARASAAAATGDSAFKAPPGAGPRRVTAEEVPRATRFAAPCVGAPMRRGPPAPGVYRAGTFALFPMPRGRPRCFAPELADPAAMEEAEGSMARGGV
jgi:hypothetical protein